MLTVLLSDLSIGQMLAVFSYLWFMIGPVEQLLGLQYAYYAAGGALQRINELLARADEPRYPPLRDPFAGRTTVGIEVRGLDFAYGEDKVLEQLDLNIGAGEKVALVGASGGGKSTLVQLLLGLYSAQRGGIRYGGCPWRNRPGLRARTCRGGSPASGAVQRQRAGQPDHGPRTQRPGLLAGFGDRPVGRRRAAPAAGLDTVVGRSGVRLSGGQRQRLAIARMILAEPKVVILDEATSALDAATEYALHQALGDFLEGRTTLIVAHRLSAVKQADRVLVFDGGHIAEDGDHQQLIAEGASTPGSMDICNRCEAPGCRLAVFSYIPYKTSGFIGCGNKTLSVPPGAGQVRQTATKLLLFAGCPPPPASWLPAGKASGSSATGS